MSDYKTPGQRGIVNPYRSGYVRKMPKSIKEQRAKQMKFVRAEWEGLEVTTAELEQAAMDLNLTFLTLRRGAHTAGKVFQHYQLGCFQLAWNDPRNKSGGTKSFAKCCCIENDHLRGQELWVFKKSNPVARSILMNRLILSDLV